MPIKISNVKYPYKCAICNKEHLAGTRSLWNANKQLVAADCLWPNKSKASAFSSANSPKQAVASQERAANANPKNEPNKPNPPVVNTNPIEGNEILEFSVQDNLAEAKKIVMKEFNMTEAFDLGSAAGIVAEVMHERFSLYITKRMQTDKLSNMERIRRERE